MTDDPRVILVGGAMRSGSTLLGSVVNAAPGHAALGESNLAWPALASGQRCSCGLPGPECPVWSQVSDGVRSDTGLSLQQIVDLDANLLRIRHLRELTPHRIGPDARRAVEVWRSMYRNFAAATGADVLIDSAKTPVIAALMSHLPEMRPKIVHLVRSPAGVMHSETQRAMHRGEVGDWQPTPRGAVSSAGNWVLSNVAIDYVRRATSQRLDYVLVRYEDLLADPVGQLRRALGDSVAGVVTDRQVQLGTSHEIAGNPGRFHKGPTTIRERDTAPEQLRADRRVGAAVVAGTIGRRYGYGKR